MSLGCPARRPGCSRSARMRMCSASARIAIRQPRSPRKLWWRFEIAHGHPHAVPHAGQPAAVSAPLHPGAGHYEVNSLASNTQASGCLLGKGGATAAGLWRRPADPICLPGRERGWRVGPTEGEGQRPGQWGGNRQVAQARPRPKPKGSGPRAVRGRARPAEQAACLALGIPRSYPYPVVNDSTSSRRLPVNVAPLGTTGRRLKTFSFRPRSSTSRTVLHEMPDYAWGLKVELTPNPDPDLQRARGMDLQALVS